MPDFVNINESLQPSDFNFLVPDDLVAHEPLPQREESKILIYNAPGSYQIDRVKNLAHILPKGTLLIFNNSKVFPSRLIGSLPSGGKIEIFLDAKKEGDGKNPYWWALGRPLKKLKPGTVITFSPQQALDHEMGLAPQFILSARVLERQDARVLLSFDVNEKALNQWLDHWGIIPLPPYIKRKQTLPAIHSPDRLRYQTVFARQRGSVAAPTAGLHFTESLLDEFASHGILTRYICLHVGSGTFLPVKSSHIDQHQMHTEPYYIPQETLEEIYRAKQEHRPVVAIGTTSFRCLEDLYRRSLGDLDTMLKNCNNWSSTDIFLYPRHHSDIYKPWIVDGLITNFHQPESTLLMLVSLLVGTENIRTIYQHAIENKLRFFSYGDTSLLWLR